MATNAEIRNLRFDLALDETALPDQIAKDQIERAEAKYTSHTREIQLQYAKVLILSALLIAARKRVTYQQNDQRENLSDIAKGLEADLQREQRRLDMLVADEEMPPVAWGRLSPVPSRKKEYPNA